MSRVQTPQSYPYPGPTTNCLDARSCYIVDRCSSISLVGGLLGPCRNMFICQSSHLSSIFVLSLKMDTKLLPIFGFGNCWKLRRWPKWTFPVISDPSTTFDANRNILGIFGQKFMPKFCGHQPGYGIAPPYIFSPPKFTQVGGRYGVETRGA